MNSFYTGVGSRETPLEILKIMSLIARELEKHGFILRTGNADGADKYFRDAVKESKNKEVYSANDAKLEDYYITEKIHPAWNNCSSFAKKLHTRNLYQVMGIDLNKPSSFVLCWTKNGKDVGGTRTAIVYARMNNIPVFNLAIKDQINDFIEFLKINYKIKLIK